MTAATSAGSRCLAAACWRITPGYASGRPRSLTARLARGSASTTPTTTTASSARPSPLRRRRRATTRRRAATVLRDALRDEGAVALGGLMRFPQDSLVQHVKDGRQLVRQLRFG